MDRRKEVFWATFRGKYPNELTDVELAVELELAAIRLFGFDTYKHENADRAADARSRLDLLDREAAVRPWMRGPDGALRKKLAAAVAANPDVIALTAENEAFIKASVGPRTG